MAGQVYLGKYEAVRPLGEGSMGKVYLAKHQGNGRQVVVKVMHEHVASQPKFRELFEREMQYMARFKHPNVVELYEASADDPLGLCIVMEYVAGTDLEELLRKEKRFDTLRIGRLLAQLCSALQAAHDEGLIHRDLKPANLMIVEPDTEGELLKVMDFGLAKLTDSVYISLDKLKGSSMTIATGTPEYMAPEQVRGDELDHRSDLYAVGVMLFELLTGKLPFRARSIDELLEMHAEEPPPKFATLGVTDVPPAIEFVVQTCLCKFPVERPQDAWDLAQRYEKALGERILAGHEPPARREEGPPPEAPPPPEDDENAVVYHLEAWMPEPIAVVKLRGYVQDVRGDVIESVPGKISVRFGKPGCAYKVPAIKKPGAFSWLLGSKPSLIDMELQMEKRKDSRGNAVLAITVLLRPEDGGPVPINIDWRACCDNIFKDLRAYLMSKA